MKVDTLDLPDVVLKAEVSFLRAFRACNPTRPIGRFFRSIKGEMIWLVADNDTQAIAALLVSLEINPPLPKVSRSRRLATRVYLWLLSAR